MKSLVHMSLLLLLAASWAKAEVSIISMDIPGLHQSDGQGEYDQIISSSVVASGMASLKIVPPARAEVSFSKCTNCCLSPANKNPEFYDYGDDTVMTKPMATAMVLVFTAAGSEPVTSLEQLKGKRVGIRRGMVYGSTVDNAGLKTNETNTISANIKKLNAGRLDAFIAYSPDVYTAFEEMGMEPLPHAKENPIAVHPDALVCKGVSNEFIEAFNNAL